MQKKQNPMVRWMILLGAVLILGGAWTMINRIPSNTEGGIELAPAPIRRHPAPELVLNTTTGCPFVRVSTEAVSAFSAACNTRQCQSQSKRRRRRKGRMARAAGESHSHPAHSAESAQKTPSGRGGSLKMRAALPGRMICCASRAV